MSSYRFKHNGETLVVDQGLRDQYDGEMMGFNELLDSFMIANYLLVAEEVGEWVELEDDLWEWKND